MNLKLKKLKMENFAGIKNQEIDFEDGKSAKIFGDNGTGKTSTANAITWLLFGKNIQGETLNNDAVPKDENTNQINELTPVVEGVFDKDGQTITLRKERRPDKEKLDGSARVIFKSSGKTHAFIDEVPYPVRKYEEYINEIIPEDLFKLLTSLNEFADLNWKQKREILFSITGDITNEDVIESNDELKALSSIINNGSIEAERKKYQAQLKKSKDELEYIPVEIKTLTNQLPHRHSEGTQIDLEAKEQTHEANINELLEARTLAVNGATEIEIKNNIANINFQIEGLERAFNDNGATKINGMQREISMIESDIEITNAQINRLEDQTKTLEKSREKLRNMWKQITAETKEVQASEFIESEQTDVCDCCGQKLPEDQIEAHKEKEAARFNEQKAKRLTELEAEMERNKREGLQLKSSIDENNKLIEKRQKQIEESQSRMTLLQRQVDQSKSDTPDVKETDEYKTLQAQLEDAQERLNNAKNESRERVKEIEGNISKEREALKEVQSQLAEFKQAERMVAKIEELERKENEIRDIIEDLTYKLHLLKEFEVTKVNLITDKVNEKFKLVKFKMFNEKLTTGELEETCEITVDGVPFDKGLNNGAKIDAALDIIETLSNHYDVKAPLFIDNAESNTDIYQTSMQQIELNVSEKDKELRVVLDA